MVTCGVGVNGWRLISLSLCQAKVVCHVARLLVLFLCFYIIQNPVFVPV